MNAAEIAQLVGIIANGVVQLMETTEELADRIERSAGPEDDLEMLRDTRAKLSAARAAWKSR